MARKKVTSAPALADWGAVDKRLRTIRDVQPHAGGNGCPA